MKSLSTPKTIPKVIPREFQIKKYTNQPTSRIFYNPNTIKWFRSKYSEDLIKKSIYSLFPNNCLPCMNEDEITPMTILLEWLSHYMKPKDKYKNVWINPKYFFSKDLYDKVLKLKEIFLQFDEDGSRKMEIDEMVTMFKTNHINVTEDDLCSLFFKGKKFRKEDINKLYLDFFQFMKFALSKTSDQDFRIFMRNIKEKILKEKENDKNEENNENDNKIDDDLFVDEKKEPVFLPMNFNLLLDYFINKGKERKSQKKIRKAIKLMRNILKPGSYPENDKDFLPDEGEEEEDEKENEGNEKKEEDEYDKQLKEINTEEIMQEFEKLFQMSYVSNPNESNINTKNQNNKLTSKNSNNKNVNEITSKRPSVQNLNENNNNNNDNNNNNNNNNDNNLNNINNINKTTNLFFTNMIRSDLEVPNMHDLQRYFYDKYHSVNLARSEAKKYMENYLKNKTINNTKFNKNNKNKKLILPNIKTTKSINFISPRNNINNNLLNFDKNDTFGFKRKIPKTRFLY